MAGAGYKLFNTGDVLTAAQVNTYLQEQAVMRFADATARTTALSGVLAEGMVSYLDDTNVVQVYNGSAWVNVGEAGDITAVTAGTGISGGGTSGDVTITNSMATAIDAKGDLIAGTADNTFSRLAVGNNGETLVADSSASTGLRWQGNFAAGKNKIINGDFNINQRNFTSNTTSGAYNFDRFLTEHGGGTVTTTPQTFTLGAAPVSGYEAKNFVRVVTASQSATSDYTQYVQRIEDVRTFAGQTVTISFWAKAGSGTPSIAAEIRQAFGSGGSAGVFTPAGKVSITTSWARYSLTVAVPSISGKTIGTGEVFLALDFWLSAGSDYNTRSTSLGLQNATIDLWGIQLEAGNVATAFQTATGTIQGELAACQRYCIAINTASTNVFPIRAMTSTFALTEQNYLPVTMRTSPTLRAGGTFTANTGNNGTVALNGSSPNVFGLYNTSANWTVNAAIGFSIVLEAEL